jgi:uridine kinase
LPEKLEKKIGKEITIISTDDFYRSDADFIDATKLDFDFNNAEKTIDKDLLIAKIKELLEGKSTLVPPERCSEDKEEKWEGEIRKLKFTRQDNKVFKKANEIIFVEGVHALQIPELNELADLKIYLDSNDSFRMMWKIMRSPYYKEFEKKKPEDLRNYGKPKSKDSGGSQKVAESIMHAFHFWSTVTFPSEKKYVFPFKENADLLLIGNNWEEFQQCVEKTRDYIDLFFKDKQAFKQKLAEEKAKNQPKTEIKEITKEIPAPKESLWKQPSTYLIFTSGFILASLIGLGIYYLRIRKKNQKS